MTITKPDSDYMIHKSKHLEIETNYPRKYGISPPWFSLGIHFDFNKKHICIFFWKFIITMGKTIDWGYPNIYGEKE